MCEVILNWFPCPELDVADDDDFVLLLCELLSSARANFVVKLSKLQHSIAHFALHR